MLLTITIFCMCARANSLHIVKNAQIANEVEINIFFVYFEVLI